MKYNETNIQVRKHFFAATVDFNSMPFTIINNVFKSLKFMGH